MLCGQICKEEMHLFLQHLLESHSIFNHEKPPGSGEIDFAEFCTLMARQMEKADPEYEYKKAFKIFDKRGDGFIDNAELKHIMLNIGEDMGDGESKFLTASAAHVIFNLPYFSQFLRRK